MRIGIIGAGRIGQVHARSVAANSKTTLAAVADPNLEAAEELVARYGGVATAEASEVIDDPGIDAVIICSPTPLHAPQVLAAAKQGKAILCEKPVASSLAEAETLQHQLEELDARVMVGFNRRFDPGFSAAQAAAAAGKVGRVEQVSIISRDPEAPPKSYIAVSGGIFNDMTIHDFDMARFLVGDIAKVSAIGMNMDPELADSGDFDGAIITLVAEDGRVATVTNSRHCSTGYDQRIEIFGHHGLLSVDNLRSTTLEFSSADVSGAREPYLNFFLDRYAQAYAIELDSFVEAVEDGTPMSPSVRDGVEALRLAEAAAESAATGSVVAV